MTNKEYRMKHGSTIVLKVVISAVALLVIAFCTLVLPLAIAGELRGDLDYLPILIGMYAAAVPFLLALWQAIKLLGYIDHNKAFSGLSVGALKYIKYCALAICTLFAAAMPYIFYLADRDDAPGLAGLGFIVIGASFVIATAAAVFQRLFQSAVDIKAENDLTV